jgi:hopanoid biosynthesis associated protein HpnK
MRQLIITGDDFGLAEPINEAIEYAHRHGILTSASLMVGAAAAHDAIARALKLPTLKVGLHLVLVEGKPVSAPEHIPDLVDAEGMFSTRLVRAGFSFFFRPAVRRQLELEIRAQFQAFKHSGLALDHVNGHNHMHLHPTVLNTVLKIGREFGLRHVRLPYEPLLPSCRAARRRLFSRFASWALLWPWMRWLKWRVNQAGLSCNDFVFGFHDSGHVRAELLERFLRHLPEGITEIYCHPATRRCPELEDTMSDYEHEEELRALVHPAVKAALAMQGITRSSCCEMAR